MTAAPPPDGVLVLNPNVIIAPAADYPADIRGRLGGAEDDFVISERRSRYSALRVSAEAARFVRRFEAPITFLEAVVAHSRDTGEDPEALLEAVFPLVTQFRAQRILLRPEDVVPLPIEPRLAPGLVVGGCRLSRCVEAQTETEIYQVETAQGALGALKWVPPDAPPFVRAALDREEQVLAGLAARGVQSVPRVLGSGAAGDGARYLVLSWCAGRNFYQLSRARELDVVTRARIGTELAAAYAELHHHGLLHGDVHPGNVVGDQGVRPVVLDFGMARWVDEAVDRPRAGLLTDYEPEAAAELLKGNPLPLATPLGEQYCVAAIVFRLITGTPCLRLSLESRTALLQIVEQPPTPWADAGVVWPGLEAVLKRALSKTPRQRFETMAAFHAALASAVAEGPPARDTAAHAPGARQLGRDPLRQLMTVYGPDQGLLDAGLAFGPTASLYYGAAGIAYAMLRAAVVEDDAAALVAADAWIEKAITLVETPSAFEGPEIGVRADEVGPTALFHTAAGLHVVRAMVRHVAGDADGAADSTRTFLAALPPSHLAAEAAPDGGRFELDLMNGGPGHLLGAWLLGSVCVDLPSSLQASLTQAGESLAQAVEKSVVAFQSGGQRSAPHYLGMAHGLGGALFALCRWAQFRGAAISDAVADALDWLAGLATGGPEGLAWPVDATARHGEPWTGWCHGSAGHVLLWSLAAAVRTCEADNDRAIGAARHLWASRGDPSPSLCCGLAGKALSLCVAARVSGDAAWLVRARELLQQAASAHAASPSPHSLWRGRLGVELALLELEHAHDSAFPVCEPLLPPVTGGALAQPDSRRRS